MAELKSVPSPLGIWLPGVKQRPCSGSPVSVCGHVSNFPEFDVVKRGCLYVKRPPKSTTRSVIKLSIKTWQKRHVVLRDACWPLDITTLDIFDRDQPLDDGTESPSSAVPSPSHTPTHHGSEGTPSLTPTATPPLVPIQGRLSIDLRLVTGVEDYLESKRFANAFIVYRSDGAPLIFGAESDLEKRCWQSSIRLLSDKVKQTTTCLGVMSLRDKARRPSCPPRLGRDVQPRLTLLSLANIHDDRSIRARVAVSLRDHQRQDVNSRSSANSLDELSSNGFDCGSAQQLKSLSAQRRIEFKPIHAEPSLSTVGDSNSYIDIVNQVITSSAGDVIPLVPRRPLRKMFSSSALIGSPQESGQMRKLLFKDRRKDSGFSESFDEAMSHEGEAGMEGRLADTPSSSGELQGSRSSCQSSDGTPPLVPRRRQQSFDDQSNSLRNYLQVTNVTIQKSSTEVTPALPPRRSIPNRNSDSPPRPPPRPAHTLPANEL